MKEEERNRARRMEEEKEEFREGAYCIAFCYRMFFTFCTNMNISLPSPARTLHLPIHPLCDVSLSLFCLSAVPYPRGDQKGGEKEDRGLGHAPGQSVSCVVLPGNEKTHSYTYYVV
jgi:hypothetical protein